MKLLRLKNRSLSIVRIINEKITYFLDSPKQGFLYALFFALNSIMIFNPITQKNVSVQKFTRTFGQGTINNYDCTRVISNFYFWILSFVVLLFGSWILFSAWKQKKRHVEAVTAVNFLDDFMVLGCVNTFLKLFSVFFNKDYALLRMSNIIIYFVIVSIFFYICVQLYNKISFDSFLKILLSIFSCSFCIFTLIKPNSSRKYFIVLFFMTLTSLLLLKCVQISDKNKFFESIINSNSITFCFFPLLTSLYFELLSILNSHSIFVTYTRLYYTVFSILLLFFAIFIAIILCRKNISIRYWKRIAYPILLIGIAALKTQPMLSSIYEVDIFESANISIPVSNFLNFGKIPIVTCYPGHMMTGVWQAFIYAFLNGDKYGAIFSPYYAWIEFPILTVLFFYFVKIILDDDNALFVTLVFPFSTYSIWNYFGMGMFIVLATISYTRKNSLLRAFLIWLSFAWCTLYRLDMGFAFLGGTLVFLVIWTFQTRNKIAIKQLVISFVITAFCFLALWFILCIFQNVNPVLRLYEFLKISASNQTWAYKQLGNPNTNGFVLCYLIVPFVVSAFLGYILFSKSVKANLTIPYWLLLVIFGFSYFFNIPRGLVRHSLVEYRIDNVLWTAPVFIACVLSVFFRKRNLFLPLLAVIAVISIQIVDESAFSSESLVESVFGRIQRNVSEDYSYKRNRTILNQDMKNWCDSYKLVADLLLEDDETFLDFMNRTFVYSEISRECPVYVAQSPLMLSGEFSQDMFIKEVEDNIQKIPIAFLPLDNNFLAASVDGILNSYRYYKVAEFIFTHYKPLFKYGDFAVWVLNERYEKIQESTSNLLTTYKFEPISYNYETKFHNYDLVYLPVIWAEKDIKKAKDNNHIETLYFDGNCYLFDGYGIEKNQQGNYLLLSIDNEKEERDLAVHMGTVSDSDNFISEYTFNFKVLNGKHDYIFRISCDYLWYFLNINAVKISANFDNVEAKILGGD